jgi:Synergist-CTERM protein sorting domain-containing protein
MLYIWDEISGIGHPQLGGYKIRLVKQLHVKSHFGLPNWENNGSHVWVMVGDISVDPTYADTGTLIIGRDENDEYPSDLYAVAQTITNYGLNADVSGNTVTVTGSVSKSASDVLYLGDITGLVVDWKADLTVTGGSRLDKGIGMINFTNGEFRLTGGTIQLPASANSWVDAIYASGNATVTVAGGKMKGDRAQDTGINAENGTLVIDSGEINIPKGNMLFAKNLTVNDPDVLNGFAFEGSTTNYTGTVYGHVTTTPDSEVFYHKYEAGDDLPDSIRYVVRDGAVWDIEGVQSDMTGLPTVAIITMTVENGGTLNFKNTGLTFKGTFEVAQGGILNVGAAQGDTSHLTHIGGKATNDGTINIYGTLTNLDKIINNGTINNYSGNTLDNQGTLTNNGTINNKATGKITNTGTIASTGTINNTEGGAINNKGIIKSDSSIANVEGNPVQPLDKNPPSSGGGCNAGFGGLAAVIIAGFFAFRKRFA